MAKQYIWNHFQNDFFQLMNDKTLTANLKNIPRLLWFGLDLILPSVCKSIG